MTPGGMTIPTRFRDCSIGKTQFRRKNSGRSAFTLLEIMMVVVIIGIMAGLVVPNLTGRKKTAQIAQTKNQIDALKTALQDYEMTVGDFPTTDEGLDALVEKPGDVDDEDWRGPYIDEVPEDPWHQEYQYVCPGQNNKNFDLWSYGPDKKDGTSDDITNWSSKKRS